ncbi:winged helix-turn-helix transcriptional regulator [Bradyrhizobium iriomotense]|uniref:winged helix-turn-helix transcriptional regulator n=1 Tax=Bradyrhizobium iriomotense TaxID=441950 RepID=UPI0024E08702|nr:winged helix-turn-helix transcriptional regulator [Bradyrhizobium iriomotense]
MKWNALAEQSSSICKALSVIGDRWTLLILNQCFLRLRRYGEIQSSLGLSKPLLAARLKSQLYHVLLALVRWGNALVVEEAQLLIREHVPCGRRHE